MKLLRRNERLGYGTMASIARMHFILARTIAINQQETLLRAEKRRVDVGYLDPAAAARVDVTDYRGHGGIESTHNGACRHREILNAVQVAHVDARIRQAEAELAKDRARFS